MHVIRSKSIKSSCGAFANFFVNKKFSKFILFISPRPSHFLLSIEGKKLQRKWMGKNLEFHFDHIYHLLSPPLPPQVIHPNGTEFEILGACQTVIQSGLPNNWTESSRCDSSPHWSTNSSNSFNVISNYWSIYHSCFLWIVRHLKSRKPLW